MVKIKQISVLKKLIEDYLNNEKEWSKIINKHYPKPSKFFKWHKFHRVIKHENKIIKIQSSKNFDSIPFGQKVENEFKSYKVIKNKINRYDAKLKTLTNDWKALEINYFKGEILEEFLKKNNKIRFIIFPIIFKVLRLSLCGIYHPQLRLRHFIIDKNNKIYLIDFGNTERTSVINAFNKNLEIFNPKSSKFLYMIKQILLFKSFDKNKNDFKTKNVHTYQLSKELNRKIHFNHMNNDEACLYIRKVLADNLKSDSSSFYLVPSFYLGNLTYRGNWSWEPVRRSIFNSIDIRNKKILVLGAGIGLLPLFLDKFNNNITAYESNKNLRKISNTLFKHFCYEQQVKPTPKNISKILNNFDYVICFDIYGCINLKKIIPYKWRCKKFLYITKLVNIQLKSQYENVYDFKRILNSDIYTYEILKK